MPPGKKDIFAPALMALLAAAFFACAVFHWFESDREKLHRANIAESRTLPADQQTIRHTLSVMRLDSAVLERRFKLAACLVLAVGCSFCVNLFRQAPLAPAFPVPETPSPAISAPPKPRTRRRKTAMAVSA